MMTAMRVVFMVMLAAACGDKKDVPPVPPNAPAAPVEATAPADAMPRVGSAPVALPDAGRPVTSPDAAWLEERVIGAEGVNDFGGGNAGLTGTPGRASYGDGVSNVKVEIDAGKPAGNLAVSIARRLLRRTLPQLSTCYEANLLRTPGISGKVKLTFDITADGRVADAKAAGFDKNVDTCVAKTVEKLVHPKPEKPTSVSFELKMAPAARPKDK